MSNSLNFLLVDSQCVVRQGLRSVIKSNYPFAEIYNASNTAEAIERLHQTKIDILVIDTVCTDGECTNDVKEILKVNANLKILVFTNLSESYYALRFIKAGVSGFLNKKSELKEIKTALDEVLYTGKYFSKYIQEKIFDNYVANECLNPLEDLSEREIEIARLLVNGKGNIEISKILEIRQNTVSTIKKRIFKKVGIDNLVDLVSYYNNYSTSAAPSF